ncbi:MAG TPA: TolC family protein [Bacteroidales bacterium]|nr:TolC family protein [Bacteroidales bacterium]
MKVTIYLYMMIMLCIVLPVQSQVQQNNESMKFSLEEARQYALKNSPVLLNSARDVEIAKKKIWETTAAGLPQAVLNSSYSYSPKLAGLGQLFTGGDTTGGGGGSPFGNFNPDDLKTSFFMNIQVSQLIFNGQYLVGLKASKVYSGLSELAETKSKTGVAENITNTYFMVLITREAKEILDSTLKTVQKTLFQTQQYYQNGFLESTDVDQLKILESNIKTRLSVSVRQIDLIDRLLKFQMGIPIDQPIELTDRIEPLVDGFLMNTQNLDSFRLENNIDYRLLLTQENLTKLNLQAQKSQFLPTISGFYQRYEDFDNNLFNDQSANTFGLTLNFPLWSSGQRLSQVSQRKIEYLKAKTNTEMAAESLMIQYETALSEYLSARDIYTMQKENRDLSLRIFKKSVTKFSEGVGSSLDLNQAQTQYLDAEGLYFNSVLSYVSAKAKLETLLAQ